MLYLEKKINLTLVAISTKRSSGLINMYKSVKKKKKLLSSRKYDRYNIYFEKTFRTYFHVNQ